jgi:hypothetical protein
MDCITGEACETRRIDPFDRDLRRGGRREQSHHTPIFSAAQHIDAQHPRRIFGQHRLHRVQSIHDL